MSDFIKSRSYKFDYIIIGAGIIGLTIAKELVVQNKETRILIMEKEADIGLHSSGRNSGVLHSGIYYPSKSIKAKVCAIGAKKMAEYCEQNQLPIHKIGKVIVPYRVDQDEQLHVLHSRACENGAKVELIDRMQLKQVEPEAHTATGNAIYSPNTCVVDPLKILIKLRSELKASGVVFSYQTDIKMGSVDTDKSTIIVGKNSFQYKILFNAAGLFADTVAKKFGAAKNYSMIPFKGSYYKLSTNSELKFNGLIYPVPDLNIPFLGVHSVKSIDNQVYFGPSALPAFGRENYYGLKGFDAVESSKILSNLLSLFFRNNNNFRNYFFDEVSKLRKNGFCYSIQQIIPALKNEYLQSCSKVGIRAQLLNTQSMNLEMDFVVERIENTIHILNAVSPAFTSAFEFSQKVVNNEI